MAWQGGGQINRLSQNSMEVREQVERATVGIVPLGFKKKHSSQFNLSPIQHSHRIPLARLFILFPSRDTAGLRFRLSAAKSGASAVIATAGIAHISLHACAASQSPNHALKAGVRAVNRRKRVRFAYAQWPARASACHHKRELSPLFRLRENGCARGSAWLTHLSPNAAPAAIFYLRGGCIYTGSLTSALERGGGGQTR